MAETGEDEFKPNGDDEDEEEIDAYWKILRSDDDEIPRSMNVGEALERLRRSIEDFLEITASEKRNIEFRLLPRKDSESGRTGWSCRIERAPSDLVSNEDYFEAYGPVEIAVERMINLVHQRIEEQVKVFEKAELDFETRARQANKIKLALTDLAKRMGHNPHPGDQIPLIKSDDEFPNQLRILKEDRDSSMVDIRYSGEPPPGFKDQLTMLGVNARYQLTGIRAGAEVLIEGKRYTVLETASAWKDPNSKSELHISQARLREV